MSLGKKYWACGKSGNLKKLGEGKNGGARKDGAAGVRQRVV